MAASPVYVPGLAATTARGGDRRIVHLALPVEPYGFLPRITACGVTPRNGLAYADRKDFDTRGDCAKCWRTMRSDYTASVQRPADLTKGITPDKVTS